MIQGQSNWDYTHTEHAWPVVHVFMTGNKSLNDYPLLKQKLTLVQQIECNNHLRGGIVNLRNLTDTSWIIACQKLGYRYAVVWHDGCWPSNEEFNEQMLTEIDRFNTEDWLVAGQLNNDEYYPAFAKSFVVLNLTNWQGCGSPNPYVNPDNYPPYIIPEPDKHFEDSLFSIAPLRKNQTGNRNWWTQSGNTETDKKPRVHKEFGDSWIPWSLRRKNTVWGLSDDIMNHITLTKPHIGTNNLELALTGKEFDKDNISYQGQKLAERTFSPSSPVYFVNTEPSHPETASQLENANFKQYVGASAGFKLLYYAYKYGVEPAFTKFVWYDFDPDSVKFKRDTMKFWDGSDYPGWVNEWLKQNPDANDSLLYLVKERWPTVVEQFGGESSWRDFWTQVSFCDYEIVQCDLINNHDMLFEKLKNERTFFWSSNIYSYIVPKLLAQQFQLEESFISLIKNIRHLNEDSWFSGTDINDNDLMCPVKAILSVTDNNNVGYE